MQLTLLRLTIMSLVLGVVHSRNYTYVGAGACRGNGGDSDKVNNIQLTSSSFAGDYLNCEAECDDQTTCVGYAFDSTLNYCILYGPELAGSCSDNADINDTNEKCLAAGSCSSDDSSANCDNTIESCVSAKAFCTTSLEATWTSSGYTWIELDPEWTGDSHATTHVHGFNANPDYVCYDADESDGVATCTDGTGGSGCAANFELADDYTENSCTNCTSCGSTIDAPTCTYTAAPEMEGDVSVHDPSVYAHGSDGYYMLGQSGACRGTGGGGATSKYGKNCDIDGLPKACGETGQDACSMTQEECRAACDLENYMKPGSCHGYHHGAWCSVFGPDLWNGIGTSSCYDSTDADSYTTDCYTQYHAIARPTEADCTAINSNCVYTTDGGCWAGYNATLNQIKETNTNVKYICWQTCGDLSAGVSNDCVDVTSEYCEDNQYADCTISAASAASTLSFATAALSAVVAFIL